ncbi:MAG: rRNA maturation RNase YbeY [Deltaproteobacteria bacterium]|nr:rRNA maturation RNase YbeY [Deltaproteobacteria bacterium]
MLKTVLKDLACHDKELSILFTDDERISKLNSQYLGREGPTNVLSFSMIGGPDPDVFTPMLGDVVISVETALRESKERGESLENTVCRLLIHGILHIFGYDHEKTEFEAEKMEKEENRLMALIMEE